MTEESKKESISWIKGLGIALVVALIWRFISFRGPVADIITSISLSLDSVLLWFVIPGFISLIMVYTNSRSVTKSIVIGFTSVVLFFIVFLLTLTEVPGVP